MQAHNPNLTGLFEKVEQNFQRTSLGPERWYILVIATLTGGNDQELCRDLYLYLIAKPEFSTSVQRQALIRRLREALVKSIGIVGVSKPMVSIMSINQCEKEEDKDHSATREDWKCDQETFERGRNWLDKLYTRNAGPTLGLFSDHKDFEWISQRITYGLYLADRQVLDDLDTQMVVVPSMMIQNLKNATHWHLRGTRRIGVSKEDLEVVWDSVKLIADFLELKLDRIPTVADIEYDV